MNKFSLFKNQHIHCTHFKECSGCALNEFVDSPPILQEARNFFKIRGIPTLSFHAGNVIGWRYRAKLAVRGSSDHPKIGLYREGTHELIDIPFCKIHHPSINQIVELMKTFIVEEKVSPYNERMFKGLLRYLQCVVERATGKVQLSLVLNAKTLSKTLQTALEKFWERENKILHSIWVNFNQRKDNVIFSPQWSLVKGNKLLWEKFGNREVCFHPSSFAQANLDLFETMLARISGEIKGGVLTEFYAGVGVIGLFLADQFEEVRCCEVVPEAKLCFDEARKRLPQGGNHLIFHTGPVSENLDLLHGADVVIMDPPRKGLDQPLLEVLGKEHSLKKLLYISCGWKAFQRDCDFLLERGWRLLNAEAYLFFPGSSFLEIVAFFEPVVRSSS